MLFDLPVIAAAFEQVDQVDSYKGCVIRIGAPTASGIQPLRAECEWPEITPARLHAVLGQIDGYGEFITCIKEEEVVGAQDDRSIVWQYSEPGWGLAPRENRIGVRQENSDGWRVIWATAAEVFTPRPGSVLMPRNDGTWTVRERADGGVDVSQDLLVDPGGRVPTWVVNWFQTQGLTDALRRLHDLAVI